MVKEKWRDANDSLLCSTALIPSLRYNNRASKASIFLPPFNVFIVFR